MYKAFVIDDSAELRDMFIFLLERHGYDVNATPFKEELLNHLVSFDPAIILLDVNMNPKKSQEFCVKIKRTHSLKKTPIILLSTDFDLLQDYKEYGAIDFIQKPFDIEELMQKIGTAIGA